MSVSSDDRGGGMQKRLQARGRASRAGANHVLQFFAHLRSLQQPVTDVVVAVPKPINWVAM